MTPAEHLAEAERLLQAAQDPSMFMTPGQAAASAAVAQAHILAAIAVELGAPHPPAAGGDTSAAAPPPGP